MSNNSVNNTAESENESANEDDYSESEAESNTESESDNSTLDGDSLDSDDEEYFIRFDSTTTHDQVDYMMIGSTCYAHTDDNPPNTSNGEGCLHDVLVYYINGYVEQNMMDKDEIKDICRLQGIDISSHEVFEHLLE